MAETTAFVVILDKPLDSESAAIVAKALLSVVRGAVAVELVPHDIDQIISDRRAKQELALKLIELYKDITK